MFSIYARPISLTSFDSTHLSLPLGLPFHGKEFEASVNQLFPGDLIITYELAVRCAAKSEWVRARSDGAVRLE